MEAAAPAGKKIYRPKARIRVQQEEEEVVEEEDCAVETCMDSFRALIGVLQQKDEYKWTDVKPTEWLWVD